MKSSWACPAWRSGKEDVGARGRWGAAGLRVDRELALGSTDTHPLRLFRSVGQMLLKPSPASSSHKAAAAQQCLNEMGRASLPLCLWLCLLSLFSRPQIKEGTSICTKQAVAQVSLSPENRGK